MENINDMLPIDAMDEEIDCKDDLFDDEQDGIAKKKKVAPEELTEEEKKQRMEDPSGS